MPFNIDLHTHTFFSGDGVSSPEENIAAAREKGLARDCDHRSQHL